MVMPGYESLVSPGFCVFFFLEKYKYAQTPKGTKYLISVLSVIINKSNTLNNKNNKPNKLCRVSHGNDFISLNQGHFLLFLFTPPSLASTV